MTEKRFKLTHLNYIDVRRLENLLNDLNDELEKVKKENNKIKTLLFQKIKELNDSYQKGAKAGMPTGGIIGELDLLEEICEEMGWSKVSSLGVTSTLMYYDKGGKNDKKIEIYNEDDWELLAQYIRLVLEANRLPKWGHYELIDKKGD